MRSKTTSPRLTLTDAIDVWRRRVKGEAVHLIAASKNVNPGRVSEVLTGKRFPEARLLAGV